MKNRQYSGFFIQGFPPLHTPRCSRILIFSPTLNCQGLLSIRPSHSDRAPQVPGGGEGGGNGQWQNGRVTIHKWFNP